MAFNFPIQWRTQKKNEPLQLKKSNEESSWCGKKAYRITAVNSIIICRLYWIFKRVPSKSNELNLNNWQYINEFDGWFTLDFYDILLFDHMVLIATTPTRFHVGLITIFRVSMFLLLLFDAKFQFIGSYISFNVVMAFPAVHCWKTEKHHNIYRVYASANNSCKIGLRDSANKQPKMIHYICIWQFKTKYFDILCVQSEFFLLSAHFNKHMNSDECSFIFMVARQCNEEKKLRCEKKKLHMIHK